ncbi:MAG: DUF4233 domain-containing protein [Thermocrispum sp.]
MSDQATTPRDPMKGFRGVMSGTLVMEAITVGLALPVISRLGGGLSGVEGWLAGAVALALLVLCAFVGRSWITTAVLALQVLLIGFFLTEASVGVIGVVFLLAWLYLFWLRTQVARRMAAGTLPSQQTE